MLVLALIEHAAPAAQQLAAARALLRARGARQAPRGAEAEHGDRERDVRRQRGILGRRIQREVVGAGATVQPVCGALAAALAAEPLEDMGA